MRDMRGAVGKKTPKKEMDNSSFFDVTWLIFKTLCTVNRSLPKYIFKVSIVPNRSKNHHSNIKIFKMGYSYPVFLFRNEYLLPEGINDGAIAHHLFTSGDKVI